MDQTKEICKICYDNPVEIELDICCNKSVCRECFCNSEKKCPFCGTNMDYEFRMRVDYDNVTAEMCMCIDKYMQEIAECNEYIDDYENVKCQVQTIEAFRKERRDAFKLLLQIDHKITVMKNIPLIADEATPSKHRVQLDPPARMTNEQKLAYHLIVFNYKLIMLPRKFQHFYGIDDLDKKAKMIQKFISDINDALINFIDYETTSDIVETLRNELNEQISDQGLELKQFSETLPTFV